ncbi:MAG: diguanylate cyclase [Planctomycetes bacterium]|nr:diguanylate cyclase [Planctomycetota bacterium]
MNVPGLIEDRICAEDVVVIAEADRRKAMLDDLRDRYPDRTFTACESFLSGIAQVSRAAPRAVIACVDPKINRLDDAVAGLRAAIGPMAKLILCCAPKLEPVAREALSSGADDYVLYPFSRRELDGALGYSRPDIVALETASAAPTASMEELTLLAEAMKRVSGKPMELIEQLAQLVRSATGARGTTVIVQGAVATAGDVVTKPVLSAALKGAKNEVIGQLTIAEHADRSYTPADIEKLDHYATIASHLLQAASKHREWRELALTDECSGLPNRRYFDSWLDEVLSKAATEQFHVTVLLFDVDDFKAYNDNYGHDAGDEVLRLTGELFRAHCREQDVVARYGGDEFAVVFWDPSGPRTAGSRHPDCALAILERFNESLRTQPFPKLGQAGTGKLTVSGGLATYPWDGTTRAALLKHADDALLAAKRSGKNRIFLIGRPDPESSDGAEPGTI